MKRVLFPTVFFILSGLLAAACAPAPEPTAPLPPVAGPPAIGAVSSPTKAEWEQKWGKVVSVAQEEGSLTIYTAATVSLPAARIALTEAIKKKYGITADFYVAGSGTELVARAKSEANAGIKYADIYFGGPSNHMELKDGRLVGDVESVIVREIAEPEAWGGKLPFWDMDRKILSTLLQINRPLVYNTDLVKQDEVATFKDLLKPQYKGKIIMEDPTYSGTGRIVTTFLARSWNIEESKDFVRQLIKQQDTVITRDARVLFEGVAKGKYAILLGANPVRLKEFLGVGAPIDVVFPREGTFATQGNGAFTLAIASPHPNAARVFLNWLLTKEGQTVLGKAQVTLSLRKDVSVEGIDSRFLPRQGETINLNDEEFQTFMVKEWSNIIAEVIREAR